MSSRASVPEAGFRCLVCREPEGEAVYRDCRDYYLGKPFPVDYYRCRRCRLLQQFPLPRDVSRFYDDYPIHARKSALYKLAQRVLVAPCYYDPRRHPAGSVLLDYGCGDGGYLERCRERGLTLSGYEPDVAHAARVSRELGVPIYADREEMLAERAGRVDVVTMHFVLEHLTDLDAAFETAHRLLKPGGTFYYTVPDADSLEARLFGRLWHNLDPPRHVSFPAQRAAEILAARHGFEPRGRVGVPFPNGIAASLSVLLTGRFRFPVFALFLPLGLVGSRLVPTANRGYRLVRR